MRVHESHYAGRAIIIFRYFIRSTQICVTKIFVSFQVRDVSCTSKRSERSELTPCIYILYYKVYIYILHWQTNIAMLVIP